MKRVADLETEFGHRILLAEDDPALRGLLTSVLTRDGYDVVPVEDGSELLLKLSAVHGGHDQESSFDLLITDDRMPGWTGMQVLAGLKAAGQHLRLILITAFADEPLRAKAVALGAAAVLDKPFDLDDFRAVVRNLLSPRVN